jgi:hypothetical protein
MAVTAYTGTDPRLAALGEHMAAVDARIEAARSKTPPGKPGEQPESVRSQGSQFRSRMSADLANRPPA